MNNLRRQDMIAALLFIAIAAIVIWIAIPLAVQEPKKVKFVALSPSYYPRIIGYCLLAFGGLLLIRQFLAKFVTQSARSASEQNTAVAQIYRPHAFTVLALVALVLFAYYWFLTSLGLVLMSAIVLAITQYIAGERSVVVITLISVLVPALLYLFFTKVANIPIPAGVLEPLLLRI